MKFSADLTGFDGQLIRMSPEHTPHDWLEFNQNLLKTEARRSGVSFHQDHLDVT